MVLVSGRRRENQDQAGAAAYPLRVVTRTKDLIAGVQPSHRLRRWHEAA